jgi:hypothetical protein
MLAYYTAILKIIKLLQYKAVYIKLVSNVVQEAGNKNT